MRQNWDQLTFLHWSYEPVVLQRLLPAGLEPDLFAGSAWVGVTPFRARVRPPGVPAAWSLKFPETNVRTYVRDGRGKRGIWFFSLDAARLSAVLGARALYHLPYVWSRMDVTATGRRVAYRSTRRQGRAARCELTIESGDPFTPGDLENFLTARWRLYALAGGRLREAVVEHPPWPLARARVLALEQTLVEAAGLPAPRSEPLAWYSPGVDVRVGPLVRL